MNEDEREWAREKKEVVARFYTKRIKQRKGLLGNRKNYSDSYTEGWATEIELLKVVLYLVCRNSRR
jgi:hypothetical protein